MSTSYLIINQPQQPQAYQKLIQKLQFLKQLIFQNQSYDLYYTLVGASRELMLKTFCDIIMYLKQIHLLARQGKIDSYSVQRLFQGVTEYLESQDFDKYSPREKAVFLLQVQTKLESCMESFNTLLKQSCEKNISNSDKENYKHVWESIQIVNQCNKKKVREQYNFMKKILILTTTAILLEAEVEWLIIKKLLFGLSIPRYFVDYNAARLKSLAFFKFPTIKMAKQIWNIPENGWSKQFLKLTFEKIAFHEKIYIPFEETDEKDFPDIYTPNRNAIKVRILYYQPLEMRDKVKKVCCDWKFLKSKIMDKKIDTIMIHMHGGGFIALSSRMTQIMTRKWANELKIPIFSIDYRKPPDHPFPAAPNDCLTAYKFIVKKISYYMNIEPKNIYLAGDSAGANLACSLMGNILIHRLPKPIGIYLAYPTIDLRNKFTPSRINSLMDPLLWPSMLGLILKQYLGGDLSLQFHPLASPLLLTQAFVGGNPEDSRFPLQWPKTFISAGQKDTFYDDSLVLMEKLKNSKIQCYCRVYSQFCHGYLSTMMLMKQCQTALQDSVKDLKRLIFQN